MAEHRKKKPNHNSGPISFRSSSAELSRVREEQGIVPVSANIENTIARYADVTDTELKKHRVILIMSFYFRLSGLKIILMFILLLSGLPRHIVQRVV